MYDNPWVKAVVLSGGFFKFLVQKGIFPKLKGIYYDSDIIYILSRNISTQKQWNDFFPKALYISFIQHKVFPSNP